MTSNPEISQQKEKPVDKFYFIHILFFLLGLMHFMPYTFFTCAIEYWMYKFRDVNSNSTDTDSRTTLQTQFAASTSIASSISSVLFLGLTTLYGNLFRVKTRMYGSLAVLLVTFALFTAFIEINTDSWQLEYFILTMLTIALITVANSILGITLFALISKFPDEYLKTYLQGNSIAGIFNSLLQILSLAIGASINVSALIYFVSGTVIIAVTFVFYMFAENLEYYKFYMGDALDESNQKKERPSLQEMWSVTKLTWACNAVFILITLTGLINPTITALVVSEDEGNSDWGDKYFVPVCSFLLFDIGDLIGRSLASYIKINFNGTVITAVNVVRLFVIVPLVMLCNARPRNHLPVVFPHDYQYIIIMLAYAISAGYFFNVAYIIIPRIVPSEQCQLAFSILTTGYGIVSAVFSVGSYFLVYLL